MKLGVVCKRLMVDRVNGYDVRKWSSVLSDIIASQRCAMMSESGVVYKTKSTGPNTEPCGTPNMTEEEEEAELLTTKH